MLRLQQLKRAGGETTSKQVHRTCVRMSAKEYELLKKKSVAAGLAINAWLMAQLESNRPTLHREEETWEAIRFMDEAGREINITARDFNSGYGTVEQLQSTVRHQRTGELDADAVAKIRFLADQLCGEIYLLANQK